MPPTLSIRVADRSIPVSGADIARFWGKVDKSAPGDCWQWTAGKNDKGYGVFWLAGCMVRAHRVAYLLTHGDVDPALALDHICFNHACVNPAHLREVTTAENMANRAGATKGNRSSGIRGVTWVADHVQWKAHARRNGRTYHAGYFDSVEDAELAAIDLRRSLGMANPAELTSSSAARRPVVR